MIQMESNPLNVSQFIPISTVSSIVDVEKAEEFLDTNILNYYQLEIHDKQNN